MTATAATKSETHPTDKVAKRGTKVDRAGADLGDAFSMYIEARAVFEDKVYQAGADMVAAYRAFMGARSALEEIREAYRHALSEAEP